MNNTKRICTMAMLIAIAFILGSAAIRIGATIKISFKFLPTFVSAVFFGPLWGGMCGLLSDALAYLINPGSGPYLIQIGLVEFLYGLSYGIFFYKSNDFNKKSIVKAIMCILINTLVLSLGAMSFILMDLTNTTFYQVLITRIPSSALNMILQISGISILLKYMPSLKKISKLQ